MRSIYAYTCLPNGLSSAPRDFTKLLKAPLAHLRLVGVTIATYIDDTYIQGMTKDECHQNVQLTKELFEKLGFLINTDKSVFTPSHRLTMLGFVLDSQEMTVQPTEDKIVKILAMCREKRAQQLCTLKDLAKLIGSLVALFPGVEYGPLHYREMESHKSSELKRHRGDFKKKTALTKTIYQELDWWIDNIQSAFKKIDHGLPHICIKTDASKIGWGATCDGKTTQGCWSKAEAGEHINYLELLGAFFGLKSLCEAQKQKHIRIELDNTTAVSYINAMGGMVSLKCNEIAKDIWQWCIARDIWISAAHIPGVMNEEADKASRVFNDRTEWQLDQRVFQDVVRTLNISPSIDLFASRLNAQLPRYVSWQPDPNATYTDAFTVDWSEFDSYMFLPFSLINRCLQKVTLETARAVIVVPLWSNQCWFTVLMTMVTTYPRLLPRNCLSVSENSAAKPPQKLQLTACSTSGKNTEARDFRMTLPVSSCQVGNQRPISNMSQSLINGSNFVVAGRLLRIMLL